MFLVIVEKRSIAHAFRPARAFANKTFSDGALFPRENTKQRIIFVGLPNRVDAVLSQ